MLDKKLNLIRSINKQVSNLQKLIVASLVMFGIVNLAHADLPPECSTSLIQFRGNYQINDLYAQIARATQYRNSLANATSADDKLNFKRASSKVSSLTIKVNELNTLQLYCMQLNPAYSYIFLGGGDSGGGDSGCGSCGADSGGGGGM